MSGLVLVVLVAPRFLAVGVTAASCRLGVPVAAVAGLVTHASVPFGTHPGLPEAATSGVARLGRVAALIPAISGQGTAGAVARSVGSLLLRVSPYETVAPASSESLVARCTVVAERAVVETLQDDLFFARPVVLGVRLRVAYAQVHDGAVLVGSVVGPFLRGVSGTSLASLVGPPVEVPRPKVASAPVVRVEVATGQRCGFRSGRTRVTVRGEGVADAKVGSEVGEPVTGPSTSVGLTRAYARGIAVAYEEAKVRLGPPVVGVSSCSCGFRFSTSSIPQPSTSQVVASATVDSANEATTPTVITVGVLAAVATGLLNCVRTGVSNRTASTGSVSRSPLGVPPERELLRCG